MSRSFAVLVRRPICSRCGMVNTVTASGYCVNCHAGPQEAK